MLPPSQMVLLLLLLSSSSSLSLKVLKSPALLLVMAGNVPAPMAVYITYTYLPSVSELLVKDFFGHF